VNSVNVLFNRKRAILITGKHHEINTDTAYVNVLTRGDLSSLHWIESPLKYFDPAEHLDQQLCRVHYAALNFRDIMLATGKLPPDAIPGMFFTLTPVVDKNYFRALIYCL